MDSTHHKNNDDYLQQYRIISAKLRKRFLRKPNVAEASEEFGALEHKLADSELWSGAGLCCIAIARCQQSLANAHAEAEALAQAARYYAKGEHATRDILCPSFGDSLLTASSCYRKAIDIHSSTNAQRQQSPSTSTPGKTNESNSASAMVESEIQGCGKNIIPAALSVELADTLQLCDQCSEALPVLQSAADMLSDTPVQLLQVLQQLHDCYILLGDLDGALQTCIKILDVAWHLQPNSSQKIYTFNNVPASIQDIISSCEVSSLFLLLILQPLPQRTPDVLKRILIKYSAETAANDSNAPWGDAGLWCLLQSLAMAAKANDWTAAKEVSVPLTSLLHLMPYHLHLLYLLLLNVNRG